MNDDIMNEKGMTCIEFLTSLHKVCHFQTREGKKYGEASTSELRRWIRNSAVEINHKRVINSNEEIMFPITQMVLFPKHPVTLF